MKRKVRVVFFYCCFISLGFSGNDWIASSSHNHRYTWHSHPILYEDSETPLNMFNSIFASGEDLVGVVQDSEKNEFFLSSKDGKMVFDVILTVVGLFVIGVNQKIIDVWGNLAKIDESNSDSWIKGEIVVCVVVPLTHSIRIWTEQEKEKNY